MTVTKTNPYVGPRTFRTEEGELFFGREREALDLLSLVISERLVLFYAQSGAGKSSLVNTRLIPGLHAEGEYVILPIGRVKGDREGLEIDNIFVFNFISSLAPQEFSESELSKLTLCQFLAKMNIGKEPNFDNPNPPGEHLDGDQGTLKKYALIIDQFEELFTTHPEAWEKRGDFFKQLAQAMQEFPHLWIVLVMREDYIAYLDPYVHLLPGKMRVRYYMQRLERDAALAAIKNPVKDIRPYIAGVAEELVENLASIKVLKPGGEPSVQAGQFIEPVQLQVVCHNLWEHLSEGTEITRKDLQDVGDVDLSLERYYDERVNTLAKTEEIPERRIREWFDKELITSSGTRAMVLANASSATGLSENVIQTLLGDLVRAELRAGQVWYELSHDRLIEPVRKSNAVWSELNLSRFQRQVLMWLQQDRSDRMLFRGPELQAAEKEAEALELTRDEQAFLEACQELRRREKRDQTQRRSIVVALIASVILLIAAVFSSIRANQATHVAREQAERATTFAALFWAKSEKLPRSLLLTVEAYRRLNNYQTQGALLDITQTSPQLRQLLFGHNDSVDSIAFSPDGKILASGGGSKAPEIILWDAATRKQIGKPLEGHTSAIHSLAFSPDGKTLASGSGDNTIILWDMTVNPPVGQTMQGPGHKNRVYSVAFSPDGKALASGSWDNTVILWDVTTRQPIGAPLTGHTYYIYSVAFSPDGKTLASGSLDKTIILWDVATHQPIGQPIQANNNYIENVTFSPDGKILASAEYDGRVTLWDVETHQKIDSLKGHNNLVWSLAFSPDGNILASGGVDGNIILWDMATHLPKYEPLKGHTGTVYDISFSMDESFASAGLDRSIILWDVKEGHPISQVLTAHQDIINSIAFSPDGKTFATGSNDSNFILWDAAKRQPIGLPHTEARHWVKAVTFSPNGNLLALGSYSAGITLWDRNKEEAKSVLTLGNRDKTYDYVFSLAFSPDGKTLASGNWEDTIILWDTETSQEIAELKGHKPSNAAARLAVTSLVYSPDGKLLASGSEDQTIILWDTVNNQQVARLKGHTGSINGVAFSPDGKILASASSDGSLILWDAETFEAKRQLSGHFASSVKSLAINAGGNILASGSTDKTIILWDIASGEPIGQPLTGHTSSINSLAFAPDANTLISTANEIIVWDLDPNSWLEESCQRAGRNLTRAEWAQYFPNEQYHATCPQWPLAPEIN